MDARHTPAAGLEGFAPSGRDCAGPALPLPGFIPFAFPGVPSVRCAFTCAPAGSMSIALSPGAEGKAGAIAARKRLFERLGLERWVELHQVHGDQLIADPAPTPAEQVSGLRGDGSCTREKGLALVITTADCQPILLTNREGTAVAALHAGWRGNTMNFPASGLKRFCAAYGLRPGDVLAVRGPSLGPAAAQFVNFHKEWPAEFRPWFDERSKTMDLWSLTRHQLTQAGLPPESLFSLDLCTHSLPDLLFSHRRGHTGRQASLIWITNP